METGAGFLCINSTTSLLNGCELLVFWFDLYFCTLPSQVEYWWRSGDPGGTIATDCATTSKRRESGQAYPSGHGAAVFGWFPMIFVILKKYKG